MILVGATSVTVPVSVIEGGVNMTEEEIGASLVPIWKQLDYGVIHRLFTSSLQTPPRVNFGTLIVLHFSTK